jgi:hypothetical protein
MTLRRTVVLSLFLTGLLWLFFSWPLPHYFTEGIPSSATNAEKWNVRRMIQGDHLQLLYNYWLFSDMLAGKTPFFYNLYEFNTGDDSKLRALGCGLDQPFTFFYALTSWIGGRAFGWNLTGFVALWLTHWFTWLLLRKYTSSDIAAALGALIAIAMPCRWVALLGGSPAGFAMMWVPIILWGVDSAIRQNQFLGGWLAAIAVLCSYWNDTHVFFFSILLIPCWCIAVIIHHNGFRWNQFGNWQKMIAALLPIAVVVIVLAVFAHSNQQEKLAGTTIADGRSFREVALYSPNPRGFFEWRGPGHDRQIYIGYLIPILIFAGFMTQLFLFFRNPKSEGRNIVFASMILGGLILMVLLALGAKGPFDALPLRAARKLIPPYSMIRQPAKIFLVLPPLLALASMVSLSTIFRVSKKNKWPAVAGAILLLAALATFGLQVDASVCLLDKSQPAYEAVARDAKENHRLPRALIVPIWPGDSAWASLYEHYVSLYRIRMINGYTPIVPRDYIENVFHALESANCGLISDAQIANLRQRGIDYILLHEDAFPEKVSYFPVGLTLKRLLNHPRLQLLKQGQNVWAFKIRNAPESRPEITSGWNIFFPNLHYEMEWSSCSNAVALEDPTASGRRFLRLAADRSTAVIQSFEHLQAPSPVLLVRYRGHGKLEFHFTLDDAKRSTEMLAADSDQWLWANIPMGDLADTHWAEANIQKLQGAVDLDLAVFCSGHLPSLAKGESFSLPGPLFFHAGYSDLEKNSIGLRPDYEPADAIVYGPKLPLTEGCYDVEMVYSSEAPEGTELGYFYIDRNGVRSALFPVISGKRAVGSFSTKESNLPICLFFVYSRNAGMKVDRFVFARTE